MTNNNSSDIIGYNPYLDSFDFDNYSNYSEIANDGTIDKQSLIPPCDTISVNSWKDMMTIPETILSIDSSLCEDKDNSTYNNSYDLYDQKTASGKKVILIESDDPWYMDKCNIKTIKKLNKEIKNIDKNVKYKPEQNNNLNDKIEKFSNNNIYSYISNFYSVHYINLIIIFLLVFIFVCIKL